MKITIWLKGGQTSMFIGGDPEKKEVPTVTVDVKDAQICIDPDSRRIVVLETR